MDESNRLKNMPENFDKVLFESIYKETKALRKKLAFEIDARKFGVDQNEVLSWFDVKFLYTFTKYYGDPRLKGYIINSLRTFKMRIVKNSYQQKYQVFDTVDIDGSFDLSYEEPQNADASLLETIQKYFRDRLTPDALLLWEIELNYPPYILDKLENSDKKIPKAPDSLILEYLGIGFTDSNVDYLKNLRKDIKEITLRAKEYFQYKSIKLL